MDRVLHGPGENFVGLCAKASACAETVSACAPEVSACAPKLSACAVQASVCEARTAYGARTGAAMLSGSFVSVISAFWHKGIDVGKCFLPPSLPLRERYEDFGLRSRPWSQSRGGWRELSLATPLPTHSREAKLSRRDNGRGLLVPMPDHCPPCGVGKHVLAPEMDRLQAVLDEQRRLIGVMHAAGPRGGRAIGLD